MSSASLLRRRLAAAGLSGIALVAFAWSAAHRDGPVAAPFTTSTTLGAVEPTGASTAAPSIGPASFHWAGADPFHVEPRVPRAAGTPCVVEIARNRQFQTEGSDVVPFFYVPPAGCPRPWSKVTLAVELSGPRETHFITSHFEIALDVAAEGGGEWSGSAGLPIFFASPQEHAQLPVWRVEREITDYASLLTRVQTGVMLQVRDNDRWTDGLDPTPIYVRSAKLLFYPPTSATPAPRVPDEVRLIGLASGAPRPGEAFPRNIERAYVDVLARGVYGNRFWFACVPTDRAEAYPALRSPLGIGNARGELITSLGCSGGSYREVEVYVDGQRAGLAPMFPWLPSNFHVSSATVDDPAPAVQALQMVPYRVDISPFAALLSDGLSHRVELRLVGDTRDEPFFQRLSGVLMLFLDRGATQVTGALTRNTLATQAPTPSVTDDLTWDAATETLQGTIATRLERTYVIEGFVDTSRGRVNHRVWQRSLFDHANGMRIVGPDPTGLDDYDQDFSQKVRLSNTVDRVSQSTRGGKVVLDDREYRSYPLVLDYRAKGSFRTNDGLGYPVPNLIELGVHQARGIRASYLRPGMARYRTALSDVFDAAYLDLDAQDSAEGEVSSARTYRFTDSLGGCYSAALTTENRALTSRTRGTGCPDGRNALRWFSYPDGAPQSMGWAPRP
jgi:hypothetical protein